MSSETNRKERDATTESTQHRCVVHGRWMIDPTCPDGTQRCSFYVPELGASEDYGCMTRAEWGANGVAG